MTSSAPDFTEATATDIVLARQAGCADSRLLRVMESVVRHLHAVVREVEPSQEEWIVAVRFLTETGRPCSYPIPTDGPVGRLLAALGRHPHRPAQIHFIVAATGFRPLTTYLFLAGDPYLASDAVFGVKPELVVRFEQVTEPAVVAAAGFDGPFWHAAYDFRLPRAEPGSAAAPVTWGAAPPDRGAHADPQER